MNFKTDRFAAKNTMASFAQQTDAFEEKQHKRTRSAVLKSIIPGNHQRKPTAPAAYFNMDEDMSQGEKYGYAHSLVQVQNQSGTRSYLREDSGNKNVRAVLPKWSSDTQKENAPTSRNDVGVDFLSHSKSSYHLNKGKSPRKRAEKEEKPVKKSKSATSLSALLSRPRSSKGLKGEEGREKTDKEHKTSPGAGDMVLPPIWAQFATQGLPDSTITTNISLNDRRSMDQDIKLSMPVAYSPSKTKNPPDGLQKPNPSRRPEPKPRPKSDCIVSRPMPESADETVSSLQGQGRARDRQNWLRPRLKATHEVVTSQQDISKDKTGSQRPSLEQRQACSSNNGLGLTTTKRGSRVMAAVAVIGGHAKELPKEPVESPANTELDPKAVESAFESLLDARNVPQNTRDKMRSLDTKIKADFVNKDTFGSGSASSVEGQSAKSSRPRTGKRSKTDGAASLQNEQTEEVAVTEESPKKSRPRSRTFTFSKGDQSPSKKQKAERPSTHQRNKSNQMAPSASSISLTPTSTAPTS